MTDSRLSFPHEGAPSAYRVGLQVLVSPAADQLVLQGYLALPPHELRAGRQRHWIRSLFLTQVRRDTCVARCHNVLAAQPVEHSDFVFRDGLTEEGQPVKALLFSIDVRVVTAGALPAPGITFVHLSAQHYRSRVLTLEVDDGW